MSLQKRLDPQPPELKAPWRTGTRIELQIEARAFARDIVLPVADKLDPQKAEMPKSLIDQMAAKGWFGITIPAEHGGMGLGVFEYCLVSEELSRAWLSVGSILARGQGLGTQTIDDARRLELLCRSAQGKWIGALALSEPTAGSDLAAVQTRAIREGDHWLLSGTKRWAGFALAANFIEVLARTREPKQGEPRSAGLETFLVVKQPGTFPDGMTGHVIDKIGYHGFLTWHLELDGVRVPEGDRFSRSFIKERRNDQVDRCCCGAHGSDDYANAVCGALYGALREARMPQMRMGAIGVDGRIYWHDPGPRNHSRISFVTVKVDRDDNEISHDDSRGCFSHDEANKPRTCERRLKMNDKEFAELQLRATIVPQQVRWPTPEHVHWQRLHGAANEARARVSKAYMQMDEIDLNPDLSREGKGATNAEDRGSGHC